tara:strand:- start:3044 stop:3349 length:306 start_codon:yes stop_codon:yes gene_type:complete
MQTLINFIKGIFSFLGDFWGFLQDVILWAPRAILSLIVDGLLSLLGSIPAPAFVQSIGGIFAAIPPGVVYFTSLFQLDFGIGVCMAALVLRFVIRLMPFIG